MVQLKKYNSLERKSFFFVHGRLEARKLRYVLVIMAQFFEKRFDPSRTVVVSNFPADVGEEELTIHFQTKKNIGGGDVDEVVVDENDAFVVFDSSTG